MSTCAIQNILKNIKRFSSNPSQRIQQENNIDKKNVFGPDFNPILQRQLLENTHSFPIHYGDADYRIDIIENSYSEISLIDYSHKCNPKIIEKMRGKVWLDDRIFDGDILQVASRFFNWLQDLEKE